MLLGWDDVRHERLVGCLPDLEAESGEAEHEKSRRRVVADREQGEGDHGLARPAGEDQRPPPHAIGEMPADVARGYGHQRADEVHEPER